MRTLEEISALARAVRESREAGHHSVLNKDVTELAKAVEELAGKLARIVYENDL